MLRKLKWQLPGEPLEARYNLCQGPVPGRGAAVEKHCPKPMFSLSMSDQVSQAYAYETGKFIVLYIWLKTNTWLENYRRPSLEFIKFS